MADQEEIQEQRVTWGLQVSQGKLADQERVDRRAQEVYKGPLGLKEKLV